MAIARLAGARLTLLAVTPALGEMVPALYSHHLAQIEKQEAREQRVYLEQVRASLTPDHQPVAVAQVTGAPAEEIVAYAEGHAIDLIVLASHGRSGLERWAFGSVAEKVLRGAPCTVLVVRTGWHEAGVEA
jgi:nucleotide-binding universal stress UspA family protein